MSKPRMKTFCTLFAIIALVGLVSCQKQPTEEERKAEIDRQVEQRLAAERQAQEKEQLAQRAADLDAREKALADQQSATATQTPGARLPSSTRQTSESSEEGSDYNIFYTKLDSYGEWRETSDYGYVWQPREAERSRNWHPYTDGRWVYTDAGWTWVSDEPFGWATYHYGRWTRLRGIGWVWVPGNEWAPAWVSWRKSDEYVGWAPLPPEARFDRGRGIHNWADNYYDIGPDQYRFVATREFGNREIQRNVVPRERNVTIINQTTNVTNITYNNTTVVNQGPNYDELQTRSQQPIERLRLERDVNVNLNVEVGRPAVRGQVLAIPAPVIAIGRPAQRPRTVRAAIAQTVVEHGWEDIGDRQAAEQARTKMKSESTPPPDAPSKKFVKSANEAPPAAETNAAPPPASPSPSIAVTATAAPAESASVTPLPTATARPHRPARLVETPGSATTPTARPAATATSPATSSPTTSPIGSPTRERATTPVRRATPSPASSPSPTSTVSSTPPLQSREQTVAPRAIPGSSPSTGAPQEEKLGERQRLRAVESQAQKFQPRRTVPMTSPTSAPTVTSSPSPSGGSTPSVSPAERLTQEEKKKQKRGRKEAAETAGSVSPSPFPSP